MKIGDIVTITTNKPYGVVDKYRVKNETGVITDFDECTAWEISTGIPETTGWWFTEDEFRLATDDEIKARLRLLLMKWK